MIFIKFWAFSASLFRDSVSVSLVLPSPGQLQRYVDLHGWIPLSLVAPSLVLVLFVFPLDDLHVQWFFLCLFTSVLEPH